MEYIKFEDFKKMDIRVGTIREVVPVPDTDKLLCCQIDFNEVDTEGNKKLRQIVSGIHEYYPDYSILIHLPLITLPTINNLRSIWCISSFK